MWYVSSVTVNLWLRTMTNKLELSDILSALDKKDIHYFSQLTVDEQKQIQPFVLMRFLTGTYNKEQVVVVNEFVNPYVFNMNNHKDLLWKLLTVCTTGKQQRYFWNKPLLSRSTKPTAINIIQEYFGYNKQDAMSASTILSSDDVIQMAEELGWQDDEINKVRKEYDLPLIKVSKTRKKTTKLTDTDILEL